MNINQCGHLTDCSCPVELSGVAGTVMSDLKPVILSGTKTQQVQLVTQIICQRYKVVDGTIVRSGADDQKTLYGNSINISPNMKKVPPPLKKKAAFMETPPYEPPPIIRDAYRYADKMVLPQYFKQPIDWAYLYSEQDHLDPFHEEVRKRSAYFMTFGKSNGRPFRIAALDGASGQKTVNATMGYSRKTREMNPAGREALKNIEEATRRMYQCMGYGPEDLGKERCVVDFDECMTGAFFGSAAGLNPDHIEVTTVGTGEPLIITSTGKKIDMLHIDYRRVMNYLENDVEFETYWTMVPKVENFFGWDKQQNDEVWTAWKKKMRLFNIPTSTFILMEKLVSRTRMLKERMGLIAIGSKSAHGGQDRLAKHLGINRSNDFKKILVEGDLKNQDQSVHAFFVEYYMSFMLVHEDPQSVDYPIKVKILQYLVPRLIQRLTRLYSDVWVLQYGGVPSGCYNTSHMDSWIMGLYFFLFCVMQLNMCEEADKEDLDALVTAILIVVYGDDHIYNKGDERVSHYLSGFNFQSFLKAAFDVDLKEIYDGVPFLSVVDRGRIVRRGVCFLKQFSILNPHKDTYPDQPTYLPFREVNEFMIRVAYGRESEKRTEKEMALAMIGHAYGTYASNRIAYDMLYHAYVYMLSKRQYDWTSDSDLEAILASKSLKKVRAMGITLEHLRKGFPTWEQLILHNTVDVAYHQTRVEDFEHHYTTELPSEF